MTDQKATERDAPAQEGPGQTRPADDRGVRRVSKPARKAIGSIRSGMAAAAGGMAAAAEPIVDRIEQAVDDVERAIAERPGARVRRVRRKGATPLPYLNDIHTDATRATRVQVGLRTIPVEDIAGTAVGGGSQRGGDFLPLKPFRGKNWAGRWQRLNRALDDLAILPPIDVVKYAGKYWVLDGHNRVGLALYHGQPEIDASVVELVPPGERRSEPIGSLAANASGSRALRTAAEGHRPSELLAHEDGNPREPVDDRR